MSVLEKHPCFNASAHGQYGRLHIPCAPKCNLNCAFCGRGLDDGAHALPGRSDRIVTPDEVRDYVAEKLREHPKITVLGIAGPGEPLYNPETFEVLNILRREFPAKMLCLGTNGYLLADKVNLLHELGVETITVTVNAVTPETMLKINPGLWDETGQYCEGIPSTERLLFRQLDGICRAVALHITVKVNAVCVPGVNDGEMDRIAQKVRDCGVQIMNVMPLKPAGRLKHALPPSPAEIHALRARLGTILPQMYHCAQCRADACGFLSESGEEAYGCIK